MRAHLAQIIIDNSPMTTEICMQLVEHSLHFDDSIAVLYHPPLSVSAVLYDARDVHTQWVTADGNFFLSYMSQCCIDYKEVYAFRSSHNHIYYQINNESSSIMTPRCYNSVYDSLYLFSLGCKRYENLPPPSQDLFSKNVLEPLLLISVGLFFYVIRSNPLLYSISNGILPQKYISEKKVILSHLKYKNKFYENDDIHKNEKKSECKNEKIILEYPIELRDFIDSVQYFQICLNTISLKFKDFKGCKKRYQNNWSDLHSWFPEGSITASDIEGGKNPVGMIAELISSMISTDRKKQKDDIPGVKPGGSKNEGNIEIFAYMYVCFHIYLNIFIYTYMYMNIYIKIIYIYSYILGENTLGEIIDFTRAQVLTMSQVLQKLWNKLQN
jgi:hypothetical protein